MTALKRKPERLAPEDARQTARLTVEQLADGFGTRGRVQSSLERMERRGVLTRRQASAGARVYEAWALGIVGARDSDAGGTTVHDPGGYRDRQLDAATEYRKLREAIGLRPWIVVFHVCCSEWSIERFANECGRGMDRKQWMGVLKLALDTAADYLGLPE